MHLFSFFPFVLFAANKASKRVDPVNTNNNFRMLFFNLFQLLMNPQKVRLRWQSKKFKIKVSQIPRHAAYIEYVKFRWDAAQRRYWTFFEAIKDGRQAKI